MRFLLVKLVSVESSQGHLAFSSDKGCSPLPAPGMKGHLGPASRQKRAEWRVLPVCSSQLPSTQNNPMPKWRILGGMSDPLMSQINGVSPSYRGKASWAPQELILLQDGTGVRAQICSPAEVRLLREVCSPPPASWTPRSRGKAAWSMSFLLELPQRRTRVSWE